MALIEPTTVRSATVVARTPVVVLKIVEPVFNQVAEEFPRIWKPLALIIAERLRQRFRFHRSPNAEPILFIGCSSESLDVANQIHLGLKNDRVITVVWNQGVFGPSGVLVDVLLKAASEADFAAFVFAPDDKVLSKMIDSDAPRDNVVFEMGLFIGILGIERTFIIKNEHVNIKIPSDLLGITPIAYRVRDPGNLPSAMGTVCTELRTVIKRLGVR